MWRWMTSWFRFLLNERTRFGSFETKIFLVPADIGFSNDLRKCPPQPNSYNFAFNNAASIFLMTSFHFLSYGANDFRIHPRIYRWDFFSLLSLSWKKTNASWWNLANIENCLFSRLAFVKCHSHMLVRCSADVKLQGKVDDDDIEGQSSWLLNVVDMKSYSTNVFCNNYWCNYLNSDF